MRITPSQAHALTVLNSEWRCPYEMKLCLTTCEALVEKGFAERQIDRVGQLFPPKIANHYRLKEKQCE